MKYNKKNKKTKALKYQICNKKIEFQFDTPKKLKSMCQQKPKILPKSQKKKKYKNRKSTYT